MNELTAAFAGLDLQDISKAQEVAEVLEKFKLRWDVSTRPLHLPTGEETPFYGIVRDDNNTVFATAKDSYVPFQNSRLAELVINIAGKAGYEIHSGGMFGGGGKVYLQLNTGNSIGSLGENKTTVKGFVTGINSHDGTHSLKWGNVNLTICCGNTYAAARKSLQQSARHTTGIFNTVDRYLTELAGLNTEMQELFNRFKRMAEVPIGNREITRVVKAITGYDSTNDDQSSYAKNRAADLLLSIGSETKQKGQTAWGLFSGVTHYTQYKMPVPKRDNATIESKYIGSGYKNDNAALELIGVN